MMIYYVIQTTPGDGVVSVTLECVKYFAGSERHFLIMVATTQILRAVQLAKNEPLQTTSSFSLWYVSSRHFFFGCFQLQFILPNGEPYPRSKQAGDYGQSNFCWNAITKVFSDHFESDKSKDYSNSRLQVL